MATPASTPMRHAPSQGRTPSQSQHGAAATPPVSTPFSMSAAAAAFSPHGPRSSPQQFKKSPATSATLMGHPTNGAVNFDSPSAAAALGALGLGGGLDLNLDNVGGLGHLNALGRVNEDERARRLDVVINILNNASQGVVSEAGLERLARRIGLECLWEDGMGIDSKSRTLIIAGSVLALEIVLSSDIVQSVSLSFPDSSEMVAKHVDKAGKILLDDLKLLPDQSALTKRLGRFAANLERLAALDKLSVLPALNLYEAMAGMFESLDRLHEWELAKLRTDPTIASADEEYYANRVLCTGSGYPAMHARDRVGLSIDYWKERRQAPTAATPAKSHSEESDHIWGILIGCAPLHEVGLPPVRVSDKWISPDIQKLNLADDEDILSTGPVLDWLEPDSTILPADVDTKADPTAAVDFALLPKLPDVAYVATFDPPVTLTYFVWEQMHHLANLRPSTEFSLTTFDNILFPIPPGSHHDPSEPRTITATKEVAYVGVGNDCSVQTHKNTLFVYKPVYGRTLTELPFSHPRQLVAMLPFLRQYALLSALLQSSFGDRPGPPQVFHDKAESAAPTTTARDEFAAFLDDTNGEVAAKVTPLSVDVTLTAFPVPRLQVVFPFRAGVANILLEIQLNGVVHIISENLTDGGLDEPSDKGKGKERTRTPESLARALSICEDIGRWCAWIRSRW